MFTKALRDGHVFIDDELFQNVEPFLLTGNACQIFLQQPWLETMWVLESAAQRIVKSPSLLDRDVSLAQAANFLLAFFRQLASLS